MLFVAVLRVDRLPFMSGKRSRRDRARSNQCSDCGKQSVSGRLVHESTCPAARALDDQMVLDRDWFEAWPGAVHRCRPITADERMELGDVAGTQIRAEALIHVKQMAPGLRARSLYVPGPDVVQLGTIGLFGHPLTFEYLAKGGLLLPPTHSGVLPTGLEVRVFAIPPNIHPTTFRTDGIDGVIVLLPDAALPVPFGTAV